MNKNGRLPRFPDGATFDRIGSTMLLGMLFLILVLSAIILIDGLVDSRRTNDTLRRLVNMQTEPSLRPGAPAGNPPQETVREIHSVAQDLLDRNTISYLFEVFAVALVAAGVFLLARTQSRARQMARYADRLLTQSDAISQIGLDAAFHTEVVALLQTAHAHAQAVNDADSGGRSEAKNAHLPYLRDSGRESATIIRVAVGVRGMPGGIRQVCMSMADNAANILKKVHETEEEKRFREIYALLCDQRFEQIADKRIQALQPPAP